MKTVNSNLLLAVKAIAAAFFLTMLLMLSSCNSNETASEFSEEDSEDATSNLIDDYSQDDAEDIGMSALGAGSSEGGKVEDSDDRFQCAEVTRTGDKASGTIRIDFGDGCKDNRGRTRRGVILISYTGEWRTVGSVWTITFENYFVNDVKLDGMRTVRNITTDTTRRRFQVDLEDGSATWPDGRIARRRMHHIREHERDGNNILIRLIIYGTAEGNHRNGRGYTIEILEPLIYDRRCAAEGVIIPVQGKKLIKHGNRQITVDYGDGTCDNVVTLININGRTKDIRVGS
jgi:hypothetical protein